MAEDMYKSQAEALAPGGNLSPEAAAELKEMAEKMGIQARPPSQILTHHTFLYLHLPAHACV